MQYFEQRPGRLAREGLAGLRASMAGIYYVPFVTGVSLHFRFAGQSIPNRWLNTGHARGRCQAAQLQAMLGARPGGEQQQAPPDPRRSFPAGRRCGGSTASKFISTWWRQRRGRPPPRNCR